MTIFIVILHVLVCLFLIAVILLQAGRGQGLSWGTFGGTPQSILGTRTASFFARLTSGCAIVFLLTCIVLNVIETRKSRSLLAIPRATGQIDLEKIKQALKEVQGASGQKTPQQDNQVSETSGAGQPESVLEDSAKDSTPPPPEQKAKKP